MKIIFVDSIFGGFSMLYFKQKYIYPSVSQPWKTVGWIASGLVVLPAHQGSTHRITRWCLESWHGIGCNIFQWDLFVRNMTILD